MVNRNRLEIFDNFVVDSNLPKFKKGEQVGLIGSIPNAGEPGINWITIQGSSTTNGNWGTITAVPSSNFDGTSGWNPNLVIEEKSFWKDLFKTKKKVKEERQKTMTILNFFSSLAQSLNDLKTLQDIGIHYETAISNAAKAGQTALVDKLKLRLESAKSEIQLVTMGLKKFLTEDQIVDFYNQTQKDKHLKLTWIKHFIKPIPSNVLEIKTKLDEQYVFDNYVILHYDPNNDATDLTKVEKEERLKREKDPILFGVIKDSRRLYYIADWIDEYCNLTLDTVIETLQERVGQINNETVKTYLDIGERQDKRVKLHPYMDNASTGSTYQSKSLIPKAYLDNVVNEALKAVKSVKKRLPKIGKKKK